MIYKIECKYSEKEKDMIERLNKDLEVFCNIRAVDIEDIKSYYEDDDYCEEISADEKREAAIYEKYPSFDETLDQIYELERDNGDIEDIIDKYNHLLSINNPAFLKSAYYRYEDGPNDQSELLEYIKKREEYVQKKIKQDEEKYSKN